MKIGGYLILTFSCVSFLLGFYKLFDAFTHPIKYENEIIFYSEKYQLSPSCVASIINVESSYNANAKSKKNAIGLMQIKLSTANYLCEIYNKNFLTEEELFSPETNIKFGCLYLKYLLEKFSNLNTALACYNAGETRVRSWLKSSYSKDGETLKEILKCGCGCFFSHSYKRNNDGYWKIDWTEIISKK